MENTYKDLCDAAQNIGSVNSVREAKFQIKLFELCESIAASSTIEELEEQLNQLIEEGE
jgi:hypothetical protein